MSESQQWFDTLSERVYNEDPKLPFWLANNLEKVLTPETREALILATEVTAILNPDNRSRITASLLRHARDLRDEGSEAVLWSALRRYASMVPIEDVDNLLEFMRPTDSQKTIQCALQGIFNIFSLTPRPNGVAVGRLKERVLELCNIWIHPDRVQTSADAAMAFCSYSALLVLGGDPDGEMLARFESLGRRRLGERARLLATQMNRVSS